MKLHLTVIVLLWAMPAFVSAQCLSIQNCTTTTQEVCDLSDNDFLLWNTPNFWDNRVGSHDLAEAEADLSILVQNTCPANLVQYRYQLFLDLDGDGVMETVIDSKTPPPAGKVYINNAFDHVHPLYNGGSLTAFDFRSVPLSQKYAFSVQVVASGPNLHTAKVMWKSGSGFALPQLPYGTHRIKWYVEDAAGHKVTCQHLFQVRDCKKPVIICNNTISAGFGPDTIATVNATSFYPFLKDNYVPSAQLKLGISPLSVDTFPVDQNGNPVTSMNFTCADLGLQTVRLWVKDFDGNVASCQAKVQIPSGPPCTSGNGSFKVCMQVFCNGLPDDFGNFEISGSGNGIPTFTFTMQPPMSGGCAQLSGSLPFAIPNSINSILTPVKDDSPLNGVTTADAARIQAHIDGSLPFTEPWQWIAADINKDGKITQFDVDELNKLIDGTYTTLPNNTSWRFVRADYVFPPDPLSQPFPEFLNGPFSFPNIDTSFTFYGIKIGDLNCTYLPLQGDHPSDRSETAESLAAPVPMPNPGSGDLTIPYYAPESAAVRFELFDLSGKAIYASQQSGVQGQTALVVPGSSFPQPGIYLWRMRIDNRLYSGKLIRL
jgi:hypothetical protein